MIVFILRARMIRGEPLRHLMTRVTSSVSATSSRIYNVMINLNAIINFLSQKKINQYYLSSNFEVKSEYKTLNDTLFRIYQRHVLRVDVMNSQKQKNSTLQKFLNADLKDINMILNIS